MKSKSQMSGTGLVFRFTFLQLLKSKGNIMSMILMLVLSMASVPILSLMGGGGFIREDSAPDGLYGSPEAGGYGLSEKAALLLSKVRTVEVSGLDEEDIEEPPFHIASGDEEDSFDEGGYTVQLGYSIILMMFCVYSISYIIRSVIEEKASKLVDTLLISVKPAALLFGKVLAVLLYVIIYMGIIIGGAALSYTVTSRFMDVSSASGAFGALLNLNLSGKGLFVVVVTSLLGYLGFGLLSGLCGAGCSSMDDASGAMSTCMLLIMAGYIVSVMGFFTSGRLRTIGCLVPVLSMFMAPMNYMNGNIGFGLVAASWGIQCLCILLLIVINARVYSRLIIYNGQRLKLMTILKMAGGKEAA